MDGVEGAGRHLLRHEQVAQIGAREVGARVTRTVRVERGFVVGMLHAFLSITGGILGALLVGVFSDYIFTPETVRYSMSLNAGLFMPCAALAFYISIKGFEEINS